MTEDLQHESVSQLFDGNTIAPQFAIALKDFMAKNLGIRVEKGVTSVTTSGSGTGKIAHGLGITPNMYSVSSEMWNSSGGQFYGLYLDPANPPDATYLYLKNSSGLNNTFNVTWSVAYIPQ